METTQENFDFESQLAFGEEGEHEVAIELLKRGVVIQPLYQYNTTKDETSPKIITCNGALIAPDLTCFKTGDGFFVEVKTKRRWINYKYGLETGFNYSHYKQYMEVKKYTGLNVWICFNHVEKEPVGKFMCEIERHHRYWDGMNEKTGERVEKPMMLYKFEVLKNIDHE